MTPDAPQPLPGPLIGRDDLAYLAPYGVFLALTALTAALPRVYAPVYALKTTLAVILLLVLRKRYTPIRWSHWWLGIPVGIIGIFQWVPMQLWLQSHFSLFAPPHELLDPFKDFSGPGLKWSFIGMRAIDAVLVVPFMEELFWRDYVWRQIASPDDFKKIPVGHFGWAPLLIVPCLFATVHGNWWLTAIVWALMIGVLLVYTKSLGACIVAHGVTNLLLIAYVLQTHDWTFW